MSFSEKLKKQMEQKNINNKELAKRIYNCKSDTDLWENLSKEKQRNKLRKVSRWLAGEAKPRTLDDAENLCEILDCDFSYLFDDNPLSNLNNELVADFLGLDAEVISRMKNYSKYDKKFLSLLIRANECNNYCEDILQQLLDVLSSHADDSSHVTITIENNAVEDTKTLKGERAYDYIISATKNKLDKILYQVSTLGVEINSIRYNDLCQRRKKVREEKVEELEKEMINRVGMKKFLEWKNNQNTKSNE